MARPRGIRPASPDDEASFRDSMDSLFAPGVGLLRDLAAEYFSDKEDAPFAGRLFDSVGRPDDGVDPEPTTFLTGDILAVTLLDIRLKPPAFRALLPTGGRTSLAALLADVPTDVRLWEASREILDSANRLWEALDAVVGVGPTTVSKLMARKRPHLIPIMDSVTLDRFHFDSLDGDSWSVMAQGLSDDKQRQRVEELRSDAVPSGTSLLRLLDVVVWMQGSGSGAAIEVRRKLLSEGL